MSVWERGGRALEPDGNILARRVRGRYRDSSGGIKTANPALVAHLKLMAAYHESAAAVAKALAETGGAPSATSG